MAELRKRLRTRQRDKGYDLYRGDPYHFVTDILDERPWSIQRRIMEAVRDHPYVAVPSCFGSGKDWTAARLGAWWVATGGILVATSNSFTQLKDIYWRELRTAHRRGDLPGQPSWGTDLRWETGAGGWAIGRKPDDNDPEGLQGIHGERVLVIIDEANGVGPALWEATRGLVVNEASRILAIGNPYEPAGPFYEACASKVWHVIGISVFDTPNFTAEPVPAKAANELVTPFWVEQQRALGLEGTPWWTAKVLGQFPDTASNQCIPLALVEAARARAWDIDNGREAAGLDVARFGTDDSVLVAGQGTGPEEVTIVHGHDTMAVAGLGARFLQDRRGTLAVDVVGVGSGVYDRLREQRLPGAVMEVQAGGGSVNDGMLNLRAELWWNVREALYRGEISLSRLDEATYARLRSELTAPTYRLTSSGKVQLESKEELKARGLPSPDVADAFVMWYHARSRARRRVASFGAVA